MSNSTTSSLWRGLFYYSGSLPHHDPQSRGESSPEISNATNRLLLFSLAPQTHSSTLVINILHATEWEKKALRKLLYSGLNLVEVELE